jgi:hypothetical protein
LSGIGAEETGAQLTGNDPDFSNLDFGLEAFIERHKQWVDGFNP